MDLDLLKCRAESHRIKRDCSPSAYSEVETIEKNRKLASPPRSPSTDSTLWQSNDPADVLFSSGSLKSEDFDCLDMLACVPESSTQKTLESKPVVFLITRAEFESSQPSESHPQSASLPDFIPPKDRRSLKNCPLKHIYHRDKRMKHEDFVIKIFRGYIKGMQWVIDGKVRPNAGIFSVLIENDAAIYLWEQFASQVIQYKTNILDSIAPENLPATDKKSKADPDRPFRSYNKNFVSSFFQKNGYLIVTFYFFCNVVFESSPDVLCDAWKMSCGKGSEHRHGDHCTKRWIELRKYAQKTMLEELDINPYEA